jgi:hypothetical protein
MNISTSEQMKMTASEALKKACAAALFGEEPKTNKETLMMMQGKFLCFLSY